MTNGSDNQPTSDGNEQLNLSDEACGGATQKPTLTKEVMDSLLWGDDFVKCYLEHADKWSHDNYMLNASGMYCVLGQALKHAKIRYGGRTTDGRIHVIVIQESGTGKDPAFDYMQEVASGAGMIVESLASTTTAGLIGTVEKGGNIIEGPAATADIIGMKEASTLFQTAKTEHSSDLIHYMNQIMDTKGYIKKRLAHGTIEYNSHSSFFGTTYPPHEGIRYIREGFVARTILGFRPIDDSYRDKTVDWMKTVLGDQMSGDPQLFAAMVSTVHAISDTVSGEYFVYKQKNSLGLAIDLVRKITSEYSATVRDTATPFITRTFNYIVKLATCHAALDHLSTEVTEEHYKQMLPYLEATWRGTLEFIDKYRPDGSSDKKLSAVEKVIRQMTENGKHEVSVRDILRKTGLTSGDVEVRLRSLVSAELITVDKVSSPTGAGRASTKVKWVGFTPNDEI